jgi:hypothetical protein
MVNARLSHPSNLLSTGLVCLGLMAMPFQTVAQTGKSLTSFENICLAEAQRAEAKHGIPAGLMQSIARVESGRKMVTGEYMPWAWTLNDQGEGLFFDDRDAALAYLNDAVAVPDHSVDVGCMQVNTKWHADGFPDIADMLDPVHNASYAAGFLLDLHAAHQSWDEAVKHYHSAEPRKNVAYHRRVLAELERFIGDAGPGSSPSDDTVIATAADNPAGDAMMSMQDANSTELAMITRTLAPMPAVAPPAAGTNPATPDVIAPVAGHAGERETDTVPVSTAARPSEPRPDDPFLAKQPNLAPHRGRVEHFRRLLAQQPG